ncbi:nuclear transport factor 2 family protein [Streptomyces kunmingensis]|uniref:Nuclear transport factor 2 family protein n=1 Tax=Streptomyces kunmingensis TaxID=68225 RepID=A0ABU6CDD2_9ACTN|nr:nuclear transport factor 2 family protein [Streptomyces kunmingensis]MEB3962729.1 nuclear transport factor 2 family protein [Streptomyces kunmingensis]
MDTTERLAAIEDLRRLMARYVRYADHQRWQDLADLFTPDGSFTPHKPDGSVWMRMEGRDGIAATVGGSGGPGVTLVHHLFSDEIDVDSATAAHGVWAMEDIVTRPSDAELSEDIPFRSMHGFGHYHARFVRTDGTWYIAELEQTRLRLDFSV